METPIYCYMGVVLKPTQDIQYSSDICRYGCVFLLRWRKTAKGRRKVRERSEYTYQNVIYYSCLADIVAFIQPLNNIFAIGMGFSIGTEKPAHPLIKIILQARNPRKVRGRLAKGESARIPPWPKMVQFVFECCHCKNPLKSLQLVFPLSGNL